MKATWILTGVLIAGALATPVVLNVIYSEVDRVPAGSLDYWLGIPDQVKSVPVVTACNSPVYSSFKRSGTTPAFSRMTYQTEASVPHVTAVIAEHFKTDGCTAGEGTQGGVALQCPADTMVTISVAPGTPCNDVLVEVQTSATN